MSVTTRLIYAATCQVTIGVTSAATRSVCPKPQVAVADVYLAGDDLTVELPLCAVHLAELRAASDPLGTARKWLA